MKSLRIVALFAILALTANLVLAEDCDDGECTSTVYVKQYFNTINCTGPTTFDIQTNYTDPCYVSERSDFNITLFSRCSSAGFTVVRTPDTTVCSASSLPYYTDTTAVGVCMQSGTAASQMFWCNKASVSTKFKAPKLATNETILSDILNPCNITTGCDSNAGTLRTYEGAGCNASTLTGAIPASAILDLNLTIGVCYTTDREFDFHRQNIMATCSNGQYKVRYSTGGCGSSSNTISVSSFPTDTCFHWNAVSWVSISCPSAASTLVASAPLVFILFVLFLVI